MEFLAEDNLAGQTLLRLVSRGASVIAELLRLSDHIPPVFLPTPSAEQEKYQNLLFDFKYLKSPELYESKIDRDVDLLDLDEEFRENHLGLLERFYLLFDSIYRYTNDLNTYISDLIEEKYVQHTIEGILLDVDGKQLMAEAVYLYGVILLLLDRRIEGLTREMMIVSYYRYKGASTIPNIDEVCNLCRNTGWSNNPANAPANKRILNYPVDFFARYPLPVEVIQMIVGRLRADDIYNQAAAYPAPEHRSTALASQAAMLYVILYFVPNILHKENATMREIVDKHFSDNWVISFYMGWNVDLSEAWEPFRAANAALSNTIQREVVSDLNSRFSQKVPRLTQTLKQLLTEGVLVEEYVLDNMTKLLNTLRECNTTLRWLVLHRVSKQKKIRDLICSSIPADDVLFLLLNIAQFEFVLKNMFNDLLASKRNRWDENKREAKDRMLELSEYFSGEKALTRVKKNEQLQNWFRDLANEIDALDYERSTVAGRNIVRLSQVLEDVQEFHQIETSLQIKQFLADTRQYLTKMLRTVNIKEETLATISIVSDFSYAWDLMTDYVPLMHARIKQDPSCVLFLRATFLKLVSILDLPLVRVNQCGSKDVISVAEYYSSALVSYVRQVLEVIPQSMFRTLSEIINIQTYQLKPMPMKSERQYLKDFAQLDLRYNLARATHQVSVFTEGILAMEKTLYGVIEVDPKQMLEDGIRKELVRLIASALHETLVFKSGKLADFENKLVQLSATLDGFRKSFEYIQDYINVYGLRIWQQEFSRIINYNVEQESNSFLKKKIYDWQSSYQSDAIPIPKLPQLDRDSLNFMGRLARELLRQTEVANTVYVDDMQGWYDAQEREVVGIRTFDLLNRSVGIFGLAGMDRLMSFMIVRDMQHWVRNYRRAVDQNLNAFIAQLSSELHPTSRLPSNAKLYAAALARCQRLWPQWLELICRLGQLLLIRRHILNELRFSAQMDSPVLASALQVLNQSLVQDVRSHYARPEENPYPEEKNPILPEVTRYLDTSGVSDPLTKIYITSEPLEGIAALLFLFVLAQVPKLTFHPRWGMLVRVSKNDPIDGVPFVLGVLALLKQFHSSHTEKFLAYLGQFVRFSVSAAAVGDTPPAELPPDVLSVMLFLEEFCKYALIDREAVASVIPPYIFDRFRHF